MKQLILLLLSISLISYSCDDDDDHQLIDLPQAIQDYLANNFPNHEIEESAEETLCDGTAVIEVELETDDEEEIELVFSNEEVLLYAESEIENVELPSEITNSVSQNYPNHTLKEASKLDVADGSTQYEVEVKQGDTTLDVLMSSDGMVLCEEEDLDD